MTDKRLVLQACEIAGPGNFRPAPHSPDTCPTPSGIEAFKKELAPYAGGKGTVRFPLGQPIPFDLVKKIVRFRVRENIAKKR